MFRLETPRLLILQTPLAVIERRLEGRAFSAPLGGLPVHFPLEWPGDALAIFPAWAEALRQNPGAPEWGGVVVEKATLTAVGQMGSKGPPGPEGAVEIGYGINPSRWGRGFASEGVAALVAWLGRQPGVHAIKAETQVGNLASIRVLRKSGFAQVGARHDAEDGDLLIWQHSQQS